MIVILGDFGTGAYTYDAEVYRYDAHRRMCIQRSVWHVGQFYRQRT